VGVVVARIGVGYVSAESSQVFVAAADADYS